MNDEMDFNDFSEEPLDDNELDEILKTNFDSPLEEEPSEVEEYDESIETEIEFEEKPKEEQKDFKASDMLDGALLITMIDIILPEIAVFVYNRYVRKGKMKKATSAKIKLKKGQINQLKPLADAMLKEMDIKGNPMVLFGFAILSIYAMNIINLTNSE